MTRPRLPDGKAKRNRITIFVDNAERDLLFETADKFNLAVGQWIRDTMVEIAIREAKDIDMYEWDERGAALEVCNSLYGPK